MPISKLQADILGVEFINSRYGKARSEFELYDLKNDFTEMKNLADDKEYSGIFETLKQRLFSEMRDSHDPLLNGDIPPYPEQALLSTEWEPAGQGKFKIKFPE